MWRKEGHLLLSMKIWQFLHFPPYAFAHPQWEKHAFLGHTIRPLNHKVRIQIRDPQSHKNPNYCFFFNQNLIR